LCDIESSKTVSGAKYEGCPSGKVISEPEPVKWNKCHCIRRRGDPFMDDGL
jgi:hypothetical protein